MHGSLDGRSDYPDWPTDWTAAQFTDTRERDRLTLGGASRALGGDGV